MLIEFKIQNFLSFRDENVLSLIANNDPTLNNNLFTIQNLKLKKSIAIFGPNGTGKTNLIKALALLKFLVINSKKFNKDIKFMELPFKLDSDYGEKKTISFEIRFLKNNNIYNYLIKISTKKVGDYNFIIEQEKLIKNDKLLFDFYEPDREMNKYEESIQEEVQKRVDLKNKNKLILSEIRDKNFDKFDEVYQWFDEDLEVLVDGFDEKEIDLGKELKDLRIKEEVLQILNNCSFSKISKIEITQKKRDYNKIIEQFKMDEILSQKAIENLKKDWSNPVNEIKLYHKDNLNQEIEFNLKEEESSGTNRFIELLVYILKSRNKGKVLVIDEIEKNLHPVLLKRIYEITHSFKQDNIQLIATTHAYPLLLYVNDEDCEIFRRDQIYFTRLLLNQSTQLYSLINIGGIRKDLKIFKAYFEGRLEGFPNI